MLLTRSGILKNGLFLMEGPRFVSDYILTGTPEWILLSDNAGALAEAAAQKAAGMNIPIFEIPRKLFDDISGTEVSQGIAAVCPVPSVNISDIPRSGVFLLLDSISDPGNMGTIIRSAAAFGCRAMIAGKGSCCPFSPKVTRAAAGLNSSLPVVFDADLPGFMRENSDIIEFIGADAAGGDIELLQRRKGCLGLVIGSEAHGISEEIRNHLNCTVAIPMTGGVESLNAAVSASILLFAIGDI